MPSLKLTQQLVSNTDVPNNQRKVDLFDTVIKGLMLEVRHSGRTFYLRYRNERGIIKQKKLADADVVKLVDARKIAQEKLTAIAMGNDPFEKKKELKTVPTLEDFAYNTYLEYVKGYKSSWKTDECLLRNHIIPELGKRYLDEITREDMVRLFSRHQKNHKAGSTNRVIILCRYIFNCAIRWEVAGATKNPTSNIDLYPENNKIERYLTDDESKRLFVELENSPNKQLKFIVAVLLLTGARKREVLDAKWSDFDLQNRVWTIRFNKSGRARHIPISDGLITILGQLPRFKDCDWLLPNPKTKQPYVQLFTAWNTARQKAGLPDVRIHDLRHSFASYLVNSGRSLYEVQKILGHTEITTTQRYAHLSHDSLMSAVDAASKSVPLLASMPKSTSSLSLLAVQQ